MALSLERPIHHLDPLSPDLHLDSERMREHGPVVPIELPGGVPMWAVTRDAAGRTLLKDAERFTKNPQYWAALDRGELPADWPLLSLAAPQGRALNTVDGPDQRALRRPLAQALTARRVENLRPFIVQTADRLLASMERSAEQAPDGVVDFRGELAWPLPMSVIGHLMGVAESDHPELNRLYTELFDDTATDSRGAEARLHAWLDALVTSRAKDPGDDLTSALLALPEDQRLARADLVVTLYVVLAAGHETTTHLLLNAVRALSTRPEQIELLHSGEVAWERAVEETMRWDSPTANFLTRFATEDVEGADIHPDAAGVRIAAGEPVLVSYIAMGRDPERYGPTAGEFDVRRTDAHTSFGVGPHFCIGAPLARLEASLALEQIFTRWPDLTVVGTVPRSPTIVVNSHTRLHMRLNA